MASEPLQRDTHPDTAIAITGATLVVAPGKEIHNAGLLIQGNKIKAILDKEKLPSSAKVINLNGYTLYPGFIDPFTDYGIKFTAEEFTVEKPVYEYPRTGAKAKNTAIHAEKIGLISQTKITKQQKNGYQMALPRYKVVGSMAYFEVEVLHYH
ncbi:hypothetical protein NFHSH190041_11440 [Shewanella sp. NFH-SH190041]|nr:hypothetical protein NFHSH190041_11440 [Shewanella sp. NFH-SH190041]